MTKRDKIIKKSYLKLTFNFKLDLENKNKVPPNINKNYNSM